MLNLVAGRAVAAGLALALLGSMPHASANVAANGNGDIGFVRADGGQTQIYAMRANGTAVVRLSDGAASDRAPAWSPDGSRIAFISDRLGRASLFVMSADGSGVTHVGTAAGSDLQPAWSPSGAMIAFTGTAAGSADVYVVRPDGSGLARLTSATDAETAPAWSSDGSQIAYVRAGAQAGIWVMHADGTGAGLVHPGVDGLVSDPTWSPDGARLAYLDVGCLAGHRAVYLAGSGGGAVARLGCGVLSASRLAWSPDAAALSFSQTGRLQGRRVRRLAMASIAAGRVHVVLDGVGGVAWSPDGVQLAAATDAGVTLVHPSGLDRIRITRGPVSDVAWQGSACTVQGTSARDVLTGTSAPDTICALRGRDRVVFGGGPDSLSGGGGIDTIDLSQSPGPALVRLSLDARVLESVSILSGFEYAIGSDLGDRLAGDQLPNVIRGARGPDHIFGGDAPDVLFGGMGGDQIKGGRGNDHIDGVRGNDRLTGGAGRDVLVGGLGNDVLNGRDGRSGDIVNGGPGSDICLSDPGDVRRGCAPPLSALHLSTVPLLSLRQLSSCFYVTSPSGLWPLVNKYATHPVRSGFNDHRGRVIAHFGVDIEAPAEAPAYAIVGGTLTSDIRRGTVEEAFRVDRYVYYHVNPPASLVDGSAVSRGQKLGLIHAGMRHVHVSEIVGSCGLVDPRRPTGVLRDRADTERPVIGPLTAFAANNAAYQSFHIGPGTATPDYSTRLPLDALRGTVDFRASVTDTPSHKTTYAQQQPLMVAGVRGYLSPIGHPYARVAPAIVPYNGSTLIPPSRYFQVMAHGTRYIAACEYDNTLTCFIRLILHVAGTGFDTRQVPNGDYRYCVSAVTIENRSALRCAAVTIANPRGAARVVEPAVPLTPLTTSEAAALACLTAPTGSSEAAHCIPPPD